MILTNLCAYSTSILQDSTVKSERDKRLPLPVLMFWPMPFRHSLFVIPCRVSGGNVPAEHTAPKHCRLLLLCDAQLPVQTAGGFFRPFSRIPYFQRNIRTLSVTDKDRHLRTGQKAAAKLRQTVSFFKLVNSLLRRAGQRDIVILQIPDAAFRMQKSEGAGTSSGISAPVRPSGCKSFPR